MVRVGQVTSSHGLVQRLPYPWRVGVGQVTQPRAGVAPSLPTTVDTARVGQVTPPRAGVAPSLPSTTGKTPIPKGGFHSTGRFDRHPSVWTFCCLKLLIPFFSLFFWYLFLALLWNKEVRKLCFVLVLLMICILFSDVVFFSPFIERSRTTHQIEAMPPQLRTALTKGRLWEWKGNFFLPSSYYSGDSSL